MICSIVKTKKIQLLLLLWIILVAGIYFLFGSATIHAQGIVASYTETKDADEYPSFVELVARDDNNRIPYKVVNKTDLGNSDTLEKMDSSAGLPLLILVFVLLFGFGFLYSISDYLYTQTWTQKLLRLTYIRIISTHSEGK